MCVIRMLRIFLKLYNLSVASNNQKITYNEKFCEIFLKLSWWLISGVYIYTNPTIFIKHENFKLFFVILSGTHSILTTNSLQISELVSGVKALTDKSD